MSHTRQVSSHQQENRPKKKRSEAVTDASLGDELSTMRLSPNGPPWDSYGRKVFRKSGGAVAGGGDSFPDMKVKADSAAAPSVAFPAELLAAARVLES